MLERRLFLAAFAPISPIGFRGKPLAASYDLRSRSTTIYFASASGIRSAEYNHDTSLISRPVAATLPDLKPTKPKIYLKLEAGFLGAYSVRGKFSTLMPVTNGAELNVTYPNPAHPDVTALWSIDGRLYFTNNDYRNVYELPASMSSSWRKPELVINKK